MPEIIAPAKNIDMLNRVIEAGAGMVYSGVRGYCRREKDGIDFRELENFGVTCRSSGVKLIAAFNRIPLAGKSAVFIDGIKKAVNSGVNGVILNDPGIICDVRSLFPQLYIMASIGMSPMNWREVGFIKKAGADTVLLSEFLDLEEIKFIRKNCNVGLELFALGLKEFGYTGKCILSSYHRQVFSNGRFMGSAKRGGSCGDVCKSCFEASGTSSGEFRFRFLRYDVGEKFNELLPYIDIFKFMQGSLKGEELCDIIRSYAKRKGE